MRTAGADASSFLFSHVWYVRSAEWWYGYIPVPVFGCLLVQRPEVLNSMVSRTSSSSLPSRTAAALSPLRVVWQSCFQLRGAGVKKQMSENVSTESASALGRERCADTGRARCTVNDSAQVCDSICCRSSLVAFLLAFAAYLVVAFVTPSLGSLRCERWWFSFGGLSFYTPLWCSCSSEETDLEETLASNKTCVEAHMGLGRTRSLTHSRWTRNELHVPQSAPDWEVLRACPSDRPTT